LRANECLIVPAWLRTQNAFPNRKFLDFRKAAINGLAAFVLPCLDNADNPHVDQATQPHRHVHQDQDYTGSLSSPTVERMKPTSNGKHHSVGSKCLGRTVRSGIYPLRSSFFRRQMCIEPRAPKISGLPWWRFGFVPGLSSPVFRAGADQRRAPWSRQARSLRNSRKRSGPRYRSCSAGEQ
jgi:hypothetical protein